MRGLATLPGSQTFPFREVTQGQGLPVSFFLSCDSDACQQER